jgi:hypothetical protein
MRCLLRRMGAAMLVMLAMICCLGGAGATTAIAGPVNLRLSHDFTAAAAAVTTDAALGSSDTPVVWLPQASWFRDIHPSAPPPIIHPPAHPAAIMIPLPAPIYLGLVGLSVVILASWRIRSIAK